MYSTQLCLDGTPTQAGVEPFRLRKKGDRMRLPRKTLHTPRELMALVSYLRQQEDKVRDTMQQLLDAS